MKLQISILLFFISSFCAAQVTFSSASSDTAFTRFIDAGEEFEFATLWVRVPVSGARSIQIKPITGLMNRVSVSTVIRNATNPTVNVLTTNIANTDWHYMDSSVDLTTTGDIQTVMFLDATATVMYEIVLFNRNSTTSFLKVKRY